ncbi:hypothetical protein [Lysobacter sp. Root690]|uniref:hypothetical protein n=1 Tax=Lysobacter sp. Root690 TaxID=1736588 RepID=UPI0006FF1B4A|nr:hypothetical protein [Lysobacter sp. Root690]KRB07967.1 hypothetical protein ASD86_09195 [Lysobacter sp. Root690]
MLDFINAVLFGFIIGGAIVIRDRIADGAGTFELRSIVGMALGLTACLVGYMAFDAVWRQVGLPPQPRQSDGHPHTLTNMFGAILGTVGMWFAISRIKTGKPEHS